VIRTLLGRFRSLPQLARWGIGTAAIIVALNLGALLLDAMYGGASGGPDSSTYTTSSHGTAAYAELLARTGREVVRLRAEPAHADLPPGSTVFVLSPPDVGRRDAAALADFVEAGGRLVVAVGGEASWLNDLIADAPTWAPEGEDEMRVLAPSGETHEVSTIAAEGSGSWADPGGSLPIVGDERTAVTVASSGNGRIVLLADPTVLHNRFLGANDNAVFGLAIAGDGEQVIFAEAYHGYRTATGFGALPSRARWTLLLLAVASALVMLAYGRRFGRPDQVRRDLPPPRRAFVDALTDTLARSGEPEERVRPLRLRARAALAHRLHLAADTDDETLMQTARRHGLEMEASSIVRPVQTHDDVIRSGRASVRLIRRFR
jgi:hypothetical protein